MTENVCHSILKTATQQIIQSAGFEGANNQSIDTLTEIFERYIELLGSTVTAYANLNGRTTGTARDVSETLDELHIDTDVLKDWMEQDGKALFPSWSAQSDPGRLLQGVVNGGKPTFEDIIVYEFGNLEEFEILSPGLPPDLSLSSASCSKDDLEEEAEEPPTPSAETDRHLPDYVPAYFPAFPAEMKDEDADEAAGMLKQQQLEAEKQKQQKQKQLQSTSASTLPLPNIVKKRKKPIDNPFTHLIPFEDSGLALETTVDELSTTTTITTEQSPSQHSQQQPLSHLSQAQQKPLFLLLKQSTKHNDIVDADEENHYSKRRKSKHSHSTEPLVEALQNLRKNDFEVGEGLVISDTTEDNKKHTSEQYNELLRKQVEDAAAPGNHLFYREDRMMDDIVQRVAPPIAVSKLMTPNLLTDVAIVSSGSSTSNNSFASGPISNGNVDAGSVEGRLGKYNGSNSMLAALAKGSSVKKGYNKKFGKTGLSISKHSVDINAKKVGESKYLMKKRRMLAEKQAAAERQRILEEKMKENPNADIETLRAEIEREQQQKQQQQESSISNNHTNIHKIPQSPSQSTSVNHSYTHSASPTLSSLPSSLERKPSFSLPGPRVQATTSTSTSSTSTAQQTSEAAPAAKSGPISLSSYLANSAMNSPQSNMEKKKKPKKTPSLTLNLSQSKHNGDSSSTASSPSNGNAPRIRFKLKPPEQHTSTTDHKLKHATSNGNDSGVNASSKSNTDRVNATHIASTPSSNVGHNDAGLASSISANGNSNTKHAMTSGTAHDVSGNYNSHAYSSIPTGSYSDYTSYPAAAAAAATTTGNEEINCICENPSVDYGTFMIACDRCSTWFHGSCVGIAETDPIEEWYCKRCRKKALIQ